VGHGAFVNNVRNDPDFNDIYVTDGHRRRHFSQRGADFVA
jgi:hypothetical protein